MQERLVDEEGNAKEANGEVVSEISILTFFKAPSYQIMKVEGHVGNRRFHILIDHGSTHNFVDQEMGERLCSKIIKIPPLMVTMARVELVCEATSK